jgi:hypothetical protein
MSSSKRHFTAVIGKKEQGSYVSSSPSSAARKAVSKLCADDKKRKVVFSIRETTRDSNKKVYGPYIGYMQKLNQPIELEGRMIKYKPVAKLDKKSSKIISRKNEGFILQQNLNSKIKQKGGMNCVNERVFKNILGTCWMIAIQMMMCFGDATKEQFERELTRPIFLSRESISNLDKILKKIFPSKYSCVETIKRQQYLVLLLNAFIKRYISKIERHFPFGFSPEEKDPEQNPKRCELIIERIFKLLFENLGKSGIPREEEGSGGNMVDSYFFSNLLGIFFLKKEIYFSMHTRKTFDQINFDQQDIGIIIDIVGHSCCFFVCDGVPKFYNDNDEKIYDFNFMELLRNLKDDEDLFVIPNGVVALNRDTYFENIEQYAEYERIILLTVVSKKDFGNNFNKELKLFFDEEYDEINNFFLLSTIAFRIKEENDNDKYLYFLKKGLNDEYFSHMYALGNYYNEDMHKDNNAAIEYYQKALDNGCDIAALKLANIYHTNGDEETGNKYSKFFQHTVLNTNKWWANENTANENTANENT